MLAPIQHMVDFDNNLRDRVRVSPSMSTIEIAGGHPCDLNGRSWRTTTPSAIICQIRVRAWRAHQHHGFMGNRPPLATCLA